MRDVLYPVVLVLVGVAIVVPGYVTWRRRWPGMIAGFDPARCTDVGGLTRWVGGAGMLLGGVCVGAAAAAHLAPRFRRAVSLVLAVTLAVGAAVAATGCSRFVRRAPSLEPSAERERRN